MGTPCVGDVIAEISGGGNTVAQVIFVERLLHADGNRLEIASSQAAVGGIALGQDEQVLFLLGQHVVVGAEEAADVGHAVFLGGHGAAVAEREHLLRDLLGSACRRSRLAQLDEVRILGEAAGVEIKRDLVLRGRPRSRPARSPSKPAGRRRSCW